MIQNDIKQDILTEQLRRDAVKVDRLCDKIHGQYREILKQIEGRRRV